MAPYFRPETPLRSARIRSAGKAVDGDTKIKTSRRPAPNLGCRRRVRETPNSTLTMKEENLDDEQTHFFDCSAYRRSGLVDLHSRHGRKCNSGQGAQRRTR